MANKYLSESSVYIFDISQYSLICHLYSIQRLIKLYPASQGVADEYKFENIVFIHLSPECYLFFKYKE